MPVLKAAPSQSRNDCFGSAARQAADTDTDSARTVLVFPPADPYVSRYVDPHSVGHAGTADGDQNQLRGYEDAPRFARQVRCAIV